MIKIKKKLMLKLVVPIWFKVVAGSKFLESQDFRPTPAIHLPVINQKQHLHCTEACPGHLFNFSKRQCAYRAQSFVQLFPAQSDDRRLAKNNARRIPVLTPPKGNEIWLGNNAAQMFCPNQGERKDGLRFSFNSAIRLSSANFSPSTSCGEVSIASSSANPKRLAVSDAVTSGAVC